MMQEKLKIRYTDSFDRDLDETAYYISNDLHDPDAADRFLSEVETAIEKQRSHDPEIFTVYAYSAENGLPYYRIIVGNFIVLYVILEEDGEKVMEVRRVLYGRRNISLLIFNGKV